MTREQRFKATVGYDGTDFFGYQIQAKERTVQGEIERALKEVTQSATKIDGAGRTDAGVHATGQVIAFNSNWRHAVDDLHRALNATIPRDIVISDLTTVNREFHPRFGALNRSYRYQTSHPLHCVCMCTSARACVCVRACLCVFFVHPHAQAAFRIARSTRSLD